ncbi:TPA: ead/Ea22-like family protein [Citrobacter freundii]|uniref:ead/Ea22-like family protein n=1 Tax=Citrobacter freundii TaxID=546 RepID=UPI002925AE36|nr:ead/Ea22-like family protein [Citrobacter freundii]HCJ7746547.1 ead/Ea22-like family protein [Citrobacter freundii]
MSNIDKRALREAAEKASRDKHSQDEWFHYLRCSSPATVMALLDELEAMHKYAKDRDAENEGLMLTVGRLRVERDAAEKRIAELEAREVTLPQTFWYEHDDLSRDVSVMDARKVKKSIRDAGIRIAAAAGKGEAS